MGRAKALLPFGEVTFVEHLVATFRRSGIDDVLVTVPDDFALRLNARTSVNRYDDEGLSGSLKTALEIFPAADALIFTPVDAPFVDERALTSLIAALDVHAAACVGHRGQRGHPAGLSRARLVSLSSSTDGARGLMDDALIIESHDARVLLNINAPADLEALSDR